MDIQQPADNGQAALWNGRAGRAWVDAQEVLNQTFKSFEELLVEPLVAGAASRVLDIGCGTGSTTLAAARRLGASGRCVGVDISDVMITAARARAEREPMPASFIRADAETFAFTPASFDMIISRFGVMFFGDPVRAFANLRQAAGKDAGLRFIAWRSAADNPFMTTAERAAAPLLPTLPARRPGAPGQFAFADQSLVHRILDESGWTAIEIRPIDVACTLPETALVGYLTRLGPLGQILPDVDAATRERVITTVRAAFDPYVHGAEVRFTAACWMVCAEVRSAVALPPGTASA
ncbi:MAG: methyltransferase domain-containing protein [Rhizobiales bacterium]|nr:methyltransferase domain-containing protein [Hyphomicrobiales bacterium]